MCIRPLLFLSPMICLEELEQTFCSQCLVMRLELKDGHNGHYKTRQTIPVICYEQKEAHTIEMHNKMNNKMFP